MNNEVTLAFSRNPRYISTVRVLLNDLAEKEGYSREAIESMKVAVSEACTNALQHGYSDAEFAVTVHFELQKERMVIDVTDRGRGLCAERRPMTQSGKPAEQGLGLGVFLMQALMDEVSYPRHEESGTIVRLVKYRK